MKLSYFYTPLKRAEYITSDLVVFNSVSLIESDVLALFHVFLHCPLLNLIWVNSICFEMGRSDLIPQQLLSDFEVFC